MTGRRARPADTGRCGFGRGETERALAGLGADGVTLLADTGGDYLGAAGQDARPPGSLREAG